ncbi:MAG: hypothetical protein JXC85_01045 [Candidatus Aenigmarchaeota archaeon]|nr:hypothetical protein [Candidatus Aenigmarchaeota archaeon]
MTTDKYDYSNREAIAVAAIKDAIPAEMKGDMLAESKGGFVELFRSDVIPNHYVTTAIDGVGTKVVLASVMGIYDTVGIDCVAMAANDKAAHPCNGNAAPFLYMDYLAAQHRIEEEGLTGNIMKGIVEGLRLADAGEVLRIPVRVNIGKGETASLDEIISGPWDGYGFDLAGAMIGFIEKTKFDPDLTPRPHDEIIAFRSSGPHSNGYTDLRLRLLNGNFEERGEFRNRYKGRFSLDDKIPGTEKEIGIELLTPTKIYSKVMAKIASDGIPIIGINNTGYGLHNFNRVGKNVRYVITDPMEAQEIFKLTQEESGFDKEKMYRKFNMGMGFFVIVDSRYSDKVMGIAEANGIGAAPVGRVEKYDGGPVVIMPQARGDLQFAGYG